MPHTETASHYGARIWAALCARSAWWPPILFLVLPIWLFRQGLGTGTPPFGGDIVVLDYPLLSLIQHQLQHGLLPLWNNYAGGGYPLVPFSGLIAYPPLWPLRVLTVSDTITVLLMIHFALAGLGAYALGSVTGASRTGRTVGALGFVLSGFMIGHLYAGHLFELGVVAWMPWVFYAAHRLIERPGVRAALLLGLVAGLQVLANGLSFLVFTLYPVGALLVLALIMRLRSEGRDALRVVALWALSGLTALGLAAVIVLPFAQVLHWTIRANGLDFSGASEISLPPAALLMLFSPDVVGTGPSNTYWLNEFSLGYWHEFALYMGLLPLLGAVAAAIYQRRLPYVRFYSALALAGLVMALGRYTPIYGLAFRLPLLDLVRVPARWLLPSTLAVAVLAGPGFDWLLAQEAGARALLRALRLPLLAGAALVVALLAGVQVIYMRQGYAALDPHLFGTVQPAGNRLLIFSAFLVLALACHAERLVRARATAGLLLAFTVLDLWCAVTGSIHFLDLTPFYAPTTVSTLLHPDTSTYRVLTIDRSMPNRQGMVEGDLYDAEDFAPITLRPYFSVTHPMALLKTSTISNADVRDLITCYDARYATVVGIGEVTTGSPFNSNRLCPTGHSLAGHLVFRTAVATEHWQLPFGTSWNPTPLLSVTYLYRNPDALPRAFLVPAARAQVVSGAAAQLRAVMDASFDGRQRVLLDPHTSTAPLGLGFLQDAWARLLRPKALPIPAGLGIGETRVLTDTSNSVQVALRTAAPSYLVLDDGYYPGWQVWLDGHPATIRQADYLMRGVLVPPGVHRLTFVYASLSYLVGLAISVVTALLVALGLAWPVVRRVRHWGL